MLDYNPQSNIKETWEWFSQLCKDPLKTQQEVLKEILKNASNSKIAKKYHFNNIKNIDDFRDTLPITQWSDYEQYSLEMQNAKEDILFNGSCEVFILTSGTAGKPKLIPESKLGILAKSITDKLRQYFTIFRFSDIQKGKVLPLVNGITLGKTKSGIPFGSASGITLSNVPKTLAQMFAYPIEILQVSDSDALDYLTMRFALAQDVRFIVGNNIAKMEKLTQVAKNNADMICDDIEKGTISTSFNIDEKLRKKLLSTLIPNPKKAEELREILKQKEPFIPKNYWQNLEAICCWLSGSVGMSLQSTKHLFKDNTAYLDYGYGATEGKFNIPRIEGKSYGTLAIHAAFYEFLPVDKTDKFLLSNELKIGEYYHLYITNFSGLYRYNMKDIIKVESFYNNTPEIVFVSKSGDIGDICGEKLAGSTISHATQTVLHNLGLTLKHIEAFGEKKPPHYILYIELQEDKKVDLEKLSKEIDLELQKDLGYKNRRRDDLMTLPKIHIMPKGWLESLYKEKESKGISRTQLKLPIIRDKAIKL